MPIDGTYLLIIIVPWLAYKLACRLGEIDRSGS